MFPFDRRKDCQPQKDSKPQIPAGLFSSHVHSLGETLQRGRRSFMKLRYEDLHGAKHELVCFSTISYTAPTSPTHRHNMFLALFKAQLPCFRCTCMHVGYYRPICLCLCVCVCSSVHAISAHSIYSMGALRFLHCALKKIIQNQSSDVRSAVMGLLTWTTLTSHSGAEFFSPGATAEAPLRVTSENGAGLHLGS